MNSFGKHFWDNYASPGAGMELVPSTSVPRVPLCGTRLPLYLSHSLTLDPAFQMERKQVDGVSSQAKARSWPLRSWGSNQPQTPRHGHTSSRGRPASGWFWLWEPGTYAAHPRQALFQMLTGEVNKLEGNIRLSIIICNDS